MPDPIVAIDIFQAADNFFVKLGKLLVAAVLVWGVWHVLKAAWKSGGALGAIVGAAVAVVVALFAIRYLIVAGRGADVAEDTAKEIGMFLLSPGQLRAAVGLVLGA